MKDMHSCRRCCLSFCSPTELTHHTIYHHGTHTATAAAATTASTATTAGTKRRTYNTTHTHTVLTASFSRCRYATACSESYANHMSVVHAGRLSSLAAVTVATASVVGMRLRSTLRPAALYCDCGYNSCFGSVIGT